MKTTAFSFFRPAALVVFAASLSALAGCSSGINTMHAPTTATRATRFSAYPIDDPSPVPAGSHMPPVIGRGYGFMGG